MDAARLVIQIVSCAPPVHSIIDLKLSDVRSVEALTVLSRCAMSLVVGSVFVAVHQHTTATVERAANIDQVSRFDSGQGH